MIKVNTPRVSFKKNSASGPFSPLVVHLFLTTNHREQVKFVIYQSTGHVKSFMEFLALWACTIWHRCNIFVDFSSFIFCKKLTYHPIRATARHLNIRQICDLFPLSEQLFMLCNM